MRKTKWCILLTVFISVEVVALETVNLIKSHDFESNVDVWITELGSTNPGYSEVNAELQCEEMVYEGSYSAMSNTINRPENVPPDTRDTAVFYQVFPVTKQLADFDSLIFVYYDSCGLDSIRHGTFSADLMTPYATLTLRYHFYNDDPFATPAEVGGRKIFPVKVELNDWTEFSSDLYVDFVETKGVSPDQDIERFILRNFGMEIQSGEYYGWWGQKVYWDDIRLMGYADYDVGIKEIISGDSIEAGVPYVPVARIKNFGREDMDNFTVTAEIWHSSSLLYEEPLTLSLPGDTEDTVSFPSYTTGESGPFELIIRTAVAEGDIDESDADDVLTKTLGCLICEEWGDSLNISMELEGNVVRGFLTVNYSLPAGQPGYIKLYNTAGRLVESANVRGVSSFTFQPTLNPGVYFVTLEASDTYIVKRAIITR